MFRSGHSGIAAESTRGQIQHSEGLGLELTLNPQLRALQGSGFRVVVEGGDGPGRNICRLEGFGSGHRGQILGLKSEWPLLSRCTPGTLQGWEQPAQHPNP